MTDLDLASQVVDRASHEYRQRQMTVVPNELSELVLRLRALTDGTLSELHVVDPAGCRSVVKLDPSLHGGGRMQVRDDAWLLDLSAIELARWCHFLVAEGTPTVDHLDVTDEHEDEDIEFTLHVAREIDEVSLEEAHRRLRE